jgi:NitT/TauT family transport system permease protein
MAQNSGQTKTENGFSARLPLLTTPLLFILLIAFWWAYVVQSGVSSFILPSPQAVWKAWLGLLQSRTAWMHTGITLYETILGFLFGAIVGVLGGVVLGRVMWLEATLTPLIVVVQVLPKVAFVPLFVLWFGFGVTSKVLVAALLAFFPVLTNTVLGTKSVDPGHRDVMISMTASRWATFTRLDMPSALPFILSGMEVGVVLAIIGAIVGEYLGGNTGLGFLLVSRMNAFETAGLFAVMIHMAIVGFALYWCIGLLRRILIPWHASAQKLHLV